MRWTSDRSGAVMGFVGESVTGGMGGDYTSWGPAIKRPHGNFDSTSS
jgi:hypothetical protein